MAVVVPSEGSSRFSAELMHAAALMYYLEDVTQAEIAVRLDTSRATVGRLLSEARRQGIVTIEVKAPPSKGSADLAQDVAAALGLLSVHLAPDSAAIAPETGLGGALTAALDEAHLTSGDTLLVSSGRMLYAAARSQLPSLPGVLVAPTVGGQSDPEPWYQTNEITRAFAASIGGHPVFLHAPALPEHQTRSSLLRDPAIRRVLELWDEARCAVVGLGAPPAKRQSMPAFVPALSALLPSAVGDVCSRFFDVDGAPVTFPGSDRLISTSFEQLRAIPSTIAVAMGTEKVQGISAGARAGYFNRLVTDTATALSLLRGV